MQEYPNMSNSSPNTSHNSRPNYNYRSKPNPRHNIYPW